MDNQIEENFVEKKEIIVEEHINSSNDAKNNKKRNVIIVVIAIAIVLVSGSGYFIYVRQMNYSPKEIVKPKDINVFKYEALISGFDENGSSIKTNLETEMTKEVEITSISEYDNAFSDRYDKIDKFIADTTEIKKLMNKVEADLKITKEEYEEISKRIDLFLTEWEEYL